MPFMRQKAILLCLLVLLLPALAKADLSGVFGGRESSSFKPFPKWVSVTNRHSDSSMPKNWSDFLEDQKGKSPREQIKAVNAYMNKTRYITDIVNWGMRDYWATPLEFARRNGDCEDFAIAKFFSLLHLGFDNDDMRIVILKDHHIKAMHAVLVVRQGGDLLLLDNQIKALTNAEKVYHYDPIYSVNEDAWWRYR